MLLSGADAGVRAAAFATRTAAGPLGRKGEGPGTRTSRLAASCQSMVSTILPTALPDATRSAASAKRSSG